MKSLDDEELELLIDEITHRISLANRTGTLEDILRKAGWSDILEEQTPFQPFENGIITIIGESEIKINEMIAIAEKAGIERNRLDFYIGYEKAKTFDYKKFQFQPKYRAVLFGPVPHCSIGKGKNSSVINKMESEEGYPQVIRIKEAGGSRLKITKESLRIAFQGLAS